MISCPEFASEGSGAGVEPRGKLEVIITETREQTHGRSLSYRVYFGLFKRFYNIKF